MIVRCENCGTEFGFDDRQVGEGITVRCSVCKHVFTVESSTTAQQGWKIRTTDDMSFSAPDVGTLREWIDEGRLHPDDKVSRTGRNWVRLGDMPEFSRAFARFEGVAEVASPVREAEPARAVSNPVGPSAGLQARPARAQRVPPQSQQPTLAPPPSARAAPKRPSAGRPVIPPSTVAPDEEIELEIDEDDDDVATVVAAQRRDAPAPSSQPRREASAPQARRERSAPQARRERSAPQARANSASRRAPDPEPDFGDDDAVDELEAFESDVGKRRGIGPGLIAFLGVIAAVGVMFGVPSIRTKLLSLGQGQSSEASGEAGASQSGPEVAAAELALEKLGTAALAEAEADLVRAIDAGADSNSTAAMKVALADLLLSRAIAYQVAGALDADQRDDFRRRAEEDSEDGERIVDSLEGAPDVDRLAEVRALVRLAAGRSEVEVLPMVPDSAAETKLIVQAAVLWQDLDAPVPSGLVAGLTELPKRSGLGESVLGLAMVRAGDTVAARNVAERLLAGTDDQIVALAIRAKFGGTDADADEDTGETGESGETGGEEAGETGGDPNVAKAPPRPSEDGGSSGGSGGGSSFDRLVERGCSQVSKGDAAAGVKTLLRAFDIKPKDLDVLVCMADGYAAQGSNSRASTFYDRALEQSPSNIPALRGAAKIAVKTGATVRAKGLYERLLAADPGNATAKAFLAKHAPKDDPPAEPEPEPEPPAQPAEDTAG